MDSKRMCYTVSELAEILPLGKNSLYKLVKRNDFPKVIVGKKILNPIKQFTKWLDDNQGFNVI